MRPEVIDPVGGQLSAALGLYAPEAGHHANAGAWFSPDLPARAAECRLASADFLALNDGYGYFAALDRLIVTGPTRTNVNDFRAIFLP